MFVKSIELIIKHFKDQFINYFIVNKYWLNLYYLSQYSQKDFRKLNLFVRIIIIIIQETIIKSNFEVNMHYFMEIINFMVINFMRNSTQLI